MPTEGNAPPPPPWASRPTAPSQGPGPWGSPPPAQGPVYGEVRQQAAAGAPGGNPAPGQDRPAPLVANPFGSPDAALADLADAPTMMTPIVLPPPHAGRPPAADSRAPSRSPRAQDILEAARGGRPDQAVGGLVLDHLRASGLSGDAALAALRAAVTGIGLVPPDEPGLHAQARLGGLAPLPYGATWPMTADGRPLTFLAAVDLGILPPVPPLPRVGLLELFYDTGAAASGAFALVRCYYVPEGRTLVDTMPPGQHSSGPPQALVGVRVPVLGTVAAASGTTPARTCPPDPRVRSLRDGLSGHHLLGAPWAEEASPYELLARAFHTVVPAGERARFSPAEQTGQGWTLLAQIASTPQVPLTGEHLYLLVPREDLARGRVDRVMGVEGR